MTATERTYVVEVMNTYHVEADSYEEAETLVMEAEGTADPDLFPTSCEIHDTRKVMEPK